jgi:threonylcarbamoyladenosine tRNA methylthiotransferase MtaB
LFNLTTDVIVGFPGETESEFEASLRAVDEIGFGHVHTFPYSVRAGTRAERLPDQVPTRVKKERAARIREAGERSKRAYRERLVGRSERVLVERVEEKGGRIELRGLGEHYVPVRVEIAHDAGHDAAYENRFLDVRLVSLEDGDDPALVGVIA